MTTKSIQPTEHRGFTIRTNKRYGRWEAIGFTEIRAGGEQTYIFSHRLASKSEAIDDLKRLIDQKVDC
jgi:hypothetical protein